MNEYIKENEFVEHMGPNNMVRYGIVPNSMTYNGIATPDGMTYYGMMPNNNKPNSQILTEEEIKIVKNRKRYKFKFNNNVDLSCMCNHQENNRDVVMEVNDGSGEVYCPICDCKWKPSAKTKEEINEIIYDLINDMKDIKWIGILDRDDIKELSGLMQLLEDYLGFREEVVKH